MQMDQQKNPSNTSFICDLDEMCRGYSVYVFYVFMCTSIYAYAYESDRAYERLFHVPSMCKWRKICVLIGNNQRPHSMCAYEKKKNACLKFKAWCCRCWCLKLFFLLLLLFLVYSLAEECERKSECAKHFASMCSAF